MTFFQISGVLIMQKLDMGARANLITKKDVCIMRYKPQGKTVL